MAGAYQSIIPTVTERSSRLAVLFDAAGTLIALREPLGRTYARAAAEHGAAFDPDAIERAFARAHGEAPPMVFPGADRGAAAALERIWWRDVVRRTFEDAAPGGTTARLPEVFDRLWQHFAAPDAWRSLADAHATLVQLRRRGLVIGVISNFDQRLAPILQGLGLLEFFDTVVLPSDAGAAKPDPRIFAFALKHLGIAPTAAVYVGDDRERDVAGARGAGLHAVDVGELATLASLPNYLGSLEWK
jgi:putative hydrolase of the HAD superfamily